MNWAIHFAFLKLKARTLLVFARPQAALHVFENMLQLKPNDSYALASCAHLHAANNNLSLAIAHLQTLVKTTPVASAWFNLGFLLQQAALHGDAEAAFRQALANDERMDRAWYGLGLALMQGRQFDEAAAAFERATVLQPMSPHAWYRLAEALLALGRNDEAREVLLHLKQFEPKVAAQLERQTALHGPASTIPHAAR
ncbi:MAG: tetratricopeptide repeat protein [Pseudomonadota bacterium]